MNSMNRTSARKWAVLITAVIAVAASCGDDDVFDDTEPIKVDGTVETITVDGTDTTAPAEGARVEFIVDPGSNTLEDRVTFVDANGHYQLKVDMNEDVCAPIRYSLMNYYEQDHYACEADGNQTIDVTLVSAEEPAAGRSCETVCDRELNCEKHFQNVYDSMEACLDHCENGCKDGYIDCTYRFGQQRYNSNSTCDGIWNCFGRFCDASWRDDGDDDDAGDDDG